MASYFSKTLIGLSEQMGLAGAICKRMPSGVSYFSRSKWVGKAPKIVPHLLARCCSDSILGCLYR